MKRVNAASTRLPEQCEQRPKGGGKGCKGCCDLRDMRMTSHVADRKALGIYFSKGYRVGLSTYVVTTMAAAAPATRLRMTADTCCSFTSAVGRPKLPISVISPQKTIDPNPRNPCAAAKMFCPKPSHYRRLSHALPNPATLSQSYPPHARVLTGPSRKPTHRPPALTKTRRPTHPPPTRMFCCYSVKGNGLSSTKPCDSRNLRLWWQSHRPPARRRASFLNPQHKKKRHIYYLNFLRVL
jgi:hypothetical protein